ncbi:glycoside hydrolase family 16 [Albitalea terrae]|uniref:Glycoside hydrolase family 16 n=2 Tax=Piscinibacter terrae TaxID=2496871 RepID=A0A3N7JUJ8_9BURK|nr:glycoside hydrolase family 16 [Albitalea terrae]
METDFAASHALAFHDEFADGALNLDKWLPCHLPQWSSRVLAAARHDFALGHLRLRIDPDQPPWCPEYDGGVRVSSLQTGVQSGPLGSTRGQHRFNPRSVVREAQQRRILCAPTFGRFELRARANIPPGTHVALWMIGIEDEPEQSGEICVCEIFGRHATPESTRVAFGVHPFGDPALVDDFREAELPIDVREFHLYSADWTPRGITFHVDGQQIGHVAQSPAYPMQLMLGIYERPSETGSPTQALPQDKSFVIDHLRVHRPVESAGL